MASVENNGVRRVCLLRGGVIGYGWAARCLGAGLDVIATDPAPEAEERLRVGIENAWPALERTGPSERASQSRLSFTADLEEAVSGSDFVQESAPEREDLKRELLARVDAAAPPNVVVASSTSGFLPTSLQSGCRHPERVVVGHPFNPVYLPPWWRWWAESGHRRRPFAGRWTSTARLA